MATTAPVRLPLPGSPELDLPLERTAAGSAERERLLEASFTAIELIREARLGAIRVPIADGFF